MFLCFVVIQVDESNSATERFMALSAKKMKLHGMKSCLACFSAIQQQRMESSREQETMHFYNIKLVSMKNAET